MTDEMKLKPEDEICPVCGYYCLGTGGVGCIDKPSLVGNTRTPDSSEGEKKQYYEECEICGGDGKETCDNPDHAFIDGIGGEIGRLGCPWCGHDSKHKVVGGGKCENCKGSGFVPVSSPDLSARDNWINVEERLPEKNKEVFVVNRHAWLGKAVWSDELGWHIPQRATSIDFDTHIEAVTHRMPLPEPPIQSLQSHTNKEGK